MPSNMSAAAIAQADALRRHFTDLHAWCEVYLPGAGWIGFDPTSGLLAGEGHIPLACTPQPTSAAPVEGLIDECEVSFEHEMSVTRIYESPRVTKPYTDEQWRAILELGCKVDAKLAVEDVRLTQGGEPTFVSIDDRDGAEWNTDALGPTKRGYATSLVQKLRDEYGAGGFLHFGQGKWYPGEQLPRWALSIFWRADGQPVWARPELFADEREPSSYTTADAKRFIDALAARLSLTAEFVTPGYEDVWYYLWRERRLPVNVDPFDSRLDDELERARLRKVFEQKLETVVGYVLPIKSLERGPGLSGPRWQTGPWFFRDERMYLFPGDSPMGYRLPLDSLPWVSKGDFPYLVERDPFAPRDARQAPHSSLYARSLHRRRRVLGGDILERSTGWGICPETLRSGVKPERKHEWRFPISPFVSSWKLASTMATKLSVGTRVCRSSSTVSATASTFSTSPRPSRCWTRLCRSCATWLPKAAVFSSSAPNVRLLAPSPNPLRNVHSIT